MILLQINLENVLFVEDRISLMHDKLKSPGFAEEGGRIVELCEDWWEILRQEPSLFEVYVSTNAFELLSENIQGRSNIEKPEEDADSADGYCFAAGVHHFVRRTAVVYCAVEEHVILRSLEFPYRCLIHNGAVPLRVDPYQCLG